MKLDYAIQKIIDTMTDEEKELHKDVIQECMVREKEVRNAGKVMALSFKKLKKITDKMSGQFTKIDRFLEYNDIAVKEMTYKTKIH